MQSNPKARFQKETYGKERVLATNLLKSYISSSPSIEWNDSMNKEEYLPSVDEIFQLLQMERKITSGTRKAKVRI